MSFSSTNRAAGAIHPASGLACGGIGISQRYIFSKNLMRGAESYFSSG